MDDLLKMSKMKLKEMYIQKLIEIETLLDWLKARCIAGVDELVINSNYLENRSSKNPNDIIHKWLKKENYALDIERFQTLIDKLEKIKEEYKIGNQNLKANDDLEKGNLNQVVNEKSNQNQRGGKRKGAGRKGFGITKKVSLTLSEEIWGEIEKFCENGAKQSQILRVIIEKGLEDY